MEIFNLIWSFFQDQLLGMKWLNGLIGNVLSILGLDINSRLGGSIQFFLYDITKITILLCLLIFFISYIQSYFPPERSKENIRTFSWYRRKHYICIARDCYTFLLMFFYSLIYWIYKRWTAIRGNLFFFNFLSYG